MLNSCCCFTEQLCALEWTLAGMLLAVGNPPFTSSLKTSRSLTVGHRVCETACFGSVKMFQIWAARTLNAKQWDGVGCNCFSHQAAAAGNSESHAGGFGQDLWTSSPSPHSKQSQLGQVTEDQWPVGFWVSPVETPQPLWASCSSVWPAS